MRGDPTNPLDWLALARTDLIRARRDLAADDPVAATFWAQQAAEKSLKGWLIGKGWNLVKTHDLKRLLAEASTLGMDLSRLETEIVRLSRLYFTDRYVDDSADPEPDGAEATQLLHAAETIVTILFPDQAP